MYAQTEKIEPVDVVEEMSRSFLDYSMSVIISRALPDARDGLKPAQRRILYAMHDLHLFPGHQHIKCAKICGDTSGNYHPHGEAVIYPTLVHMAQPWVMRERLIEGQGNFGSVEGDPPAAMRYTEARLTQLGAALMDDINQDTVELISNYDERLTEPTVFPAAFPNLLVNGGTGIAVGMATSIPPHNLGETIDAICATINDPGITVDKLLTYIRGPDFPTGCQICGISGIREYFETGRGSFKVRGKACIEEMKGSREQIVVTDIPYNVNRATLVERIAQLVNEKVITEVSAVRDESDEHTRVVIELKRDTVPQVVINNLFKYTQLEVSFPVCMLAIDNGKPKLLSLKEALQSYTEHRRAVILRRTGFLLRQAEDRAEKLEGYLIALSNLEDFIQIARASTYREEAKVRLMAYNLALSQVQSIGVCIRSAARLTNGRYPFSETQADAVLELRLYQLTSLEQNKLKEEYRKLLENIDDLKDIQAHEARVLSLMQSELRAIQARHATARLTEIIPEESQFHIEDLVVNEGCIVTVTHGGFIKRTAVSVYRAQRRGGRGVISMSTREEIGQEGDFIEHLFTASTHDYLMFFTKQGRCYVKKVYEIQEMGRTSKGRSIANLLNLQPKESIAAMLRIQSKVIHTTDTAAAEDHTWDASLHILFATESGIVKKSNLSNFSNVRRVGIIAIKIASGDQLVDATLTSGEAEIVLVTRMGMSIRFHERELRDQGRDTVGVVGIRLGQEDRVVAASVVQPHNTLLVAGENGIGKRSAFHDYRLQSRAGKGIITMRTKGKTGYVVGALSVSDQDELMLITTGGQLVRTHVLEIRRAGRNTMGVKLISLQTNEKLQAIAKVVN